MRCANCPLKDATQVESDYQGLKPEEIQVAFVGEAPGKTELVTGKPFTGAAGDVMRGTANAYDCPPYALLNATQCLPDKYLQEECRGACRPRLVKELKRIKPKLIVALGGTAITSLTGKTTVMNLVRKVFHTDLGPVMASLHPAWYLYQYHTNDHITDFFDSIKFAVNLVKGKYPSVSDDPHYVVPSNLEELQTYLDIVRGEQVAIDLETTGFDPIDDDILCVIISTETLTIVIPWEVCTQKDVFPVIKAYLEQCQHVTYVGNFDLAFFRQRGIDIHLQHDLFLVHHTNDETRTNTSLKVRARIELGVEDWEGEIKKFAPKKSDSYAKVPKPILYKYGALDGHYTKHLQAVMDPEMDDNAKEILGRIMVPASDCFIDIQLRGIPVSAQKILDAAEKLDLRMGSVTADLQQMSGVSIFNPRAAHEVKRQLYGEMDFPDLNEGSTDRPTLEALQAKCQDNPNIGFVDLMLQHRDLQKTRGTYIGELARFTKRDSRLHPQFNICGTETGRVTCTRPNLLNVKEIDIIKEIYIAPEGWLYGCADQSQSELRVYAGLAEDQGLTDFFVKRQEAIARGEEPEDIHDYAWRITGCASRVIAKTFVFGPLYGRTAEAIATALGIELFEALRIRKEIMSLFQRSDAYANERMQEVFTTQQVVNPFGRVRHFPYLSENELHHIRNVAINSPIQSTSNDLNFLALIKLCKMADNKEIVFWPLQPIHDSINYLTLESEWDHTATVITEVMESCAKEEIGGWFNTMPFEVKIGKGYNWEEADPSPGGPGRTSTRQLDQLVRR